MSTQLREALTAANVPALQPKIISPVLLEYQRRYAPLLRAVPSGQWGADTYYFNQRTSRANGGFVTDGGARAQSQSTYVQNDFKMKHLQAIGSVTGYAQEVTQQVIGNLRAREIEGTIQGLYWDVETAMLWGNAGSTQYGAYPQFDGLDSLCTSFGGSSQNVQDKAGSALTLAHLDQLADMVETNAAMSVFDSNWMYVLSNTAVSKIAQLLQNQQRFVDQVEIAAGLLVPTYRNIPLMKTSFLATRGFSVAAVTATTSATGGTLPVGNYRYSIAAVMARQGEIAGSAEVVQATTGTTSSITLSFAIPGGYEGAQPIAYKVYRSTGGAGTPTLLGIVDATVGLAADGITPIMTTSIVDDGITLTAKAGSLVPAQNPPVYQGTNANLFPPAPGLENLYLIPRSEDYIYRPYVRELVPLDVYPTTASPDSLPYALITDTTLALRAPKYVGRLTRVGVSV